MRYQQYSVSCYFLRTLEEIQHNISDLLKLINKKPDFDESNQVSREALNDFFGDQIKIRILNDDINTSFSEVNSFFEAVQNYQQMAEVLSANYSAAITGEENIQEINIDNLNDVDEEILEDDGSDDVDVCSLSDEEYDAYSANLSKQEPV